MRKHVRFGLGICLAILVSACGGGGGETEPPESTAQPTPTEEPPTQEGPPPLTIDLETTSVQLVSDDIFGADKSISGTYEGTAPGELLSISFHTDSPHIEYVSINQDESEFSLLFSAFDDLPPGTYSGEVSVDICVEDTDCSRRAEGSPILFSYTLELININPILTLENHGPEVTFTEADYFVRELQSQTIDIHYIDGEPEPTFRLQIDPPAGYTLQPLEEELVRVFSVDQVDSTTFDLRAPRYDAALEYIRFALWFAGPGGESREIDLHFTPHLRSGAADQIEVSLPEVHLSNISPSSGEQAELKISLPLGVDDYSIEVDYQDGSDWLQSSKGEKGKLSVDANSDTLSPGRYRATLTLTADSGTSAPKDIPIYFYVSEHHLFHANLSEYFVENDGLNGFINTDTIDFLDIDGTPYDWEITSTVPWLVPQMSAGAMPMNTVSNIAFPVDEIRQLDPRKSHIGQLIVQTSHERAPWLLVKTILHINVATLYSVTPLNVAANQPFTLVLKGAGLKYTSAYVGELSFMLNDENVTLSTNSRGSLTADLDTASIDIDGLAPGSYEVGMTNSLGVATETFTLTVTE